MLKFKYIPKSNIVNLITSNISNYNGEYIEGIFEEETKNQIGTYGLYLVCELEFKGGSSYYTNPLAVVAKNDYDAIRVFFMHTDKEGSIVCKLADHCKDVTNIKPFD